MTTANKLPPDVLEDRLSECKTTYKLNVGYAGMPQLPAGFVDLVKKYNPHITELELSSNNLTDLPDDISELQQIRVLRFKYNQLKRLPSAITRLPQLLTLELSGNQITRLDSSIAHLANLKELDLSGNLLVELPQSVATLPKLEVLRLENNRLEALPDNIGEMPSLTKLDISTNCLRQLPASMGRLKRIQRIDAANNMLVRVPPSVGHLKTIKELNLRYNNLDDRYKAKAEEGLSRLLAFLREEEERERLEEVERLRPIGTAVGPYMEYRCKAEASQVLKTEFGEFTVDNRCWIRTGFSLTQVNNMVYVFGGQLVKDGSISNELFWMTSERMEWHSQPTRGDRPCGRYGHVAVYDSDHHQLVVFGGRNADKKRLADVAVLDLDSFTWRRPAVNGTAPSPREGAGAVYHAGHMVVFAGHATGGRTNDLLLLELSGWTWSQPTTTGTAPSPRSNAAITVGNGHYLIIHGGRNIFVLDDMHVLDLLTRMWIGVTPRGMLPPPRHSHTLHMHNDWLYLFGGVNELGASTVSLFKAQISRTAMDRAGALHAAAAGTGLGGGVVEAADAASAAVAIEWQELDPELPYNKDRSGVMQQGQLRCYQLGSATLGRTMNEDDAKKGLVFWDVFKTAKLDSFKPKAVAAQDGEGGGTTARSQGSSKSSRVQHTTHSAGKMPPSFTTNSKKEQKMLAYIRDFQRVFQELYPHRRPMPLTPLNECGVPKFLCTKLRPSLPAFPELYTLEGCAKFMAEFLTYEPLEEPLHPPAHLPSPMSVLTWQAADAFDAAAVLCSLLLGAGYNAFVVMGYAPLAVTLNDQSGTEFVLPDCQEFNDTAAEAGPSGSQRQQQQQGNSSSSSIRASTASTATAAAAAASSGAGAAEAAGAPGASNSSSNSSSGKPGAPGAAGGVVAVDEPGKRKRYQVGPKPQLASKYIQEHGQAAEPSTSGTTAATSAAVSSSQTPEPGAASRKDAEGELAAGEAEDSQEALAAEPSQQHKMQRNNRVHAWVLVLPGRREIAEPVFIEPASGRRTSPSSPDCPYSGVEMIWNASNAWICMQMLEPHSDSRALPGLISWELTNPALWEQVLNDRQTRPARFELPAENARTGAGHGPPGIVSRPGLASTMNASNMMSSMMVGRPRTPSTFNLPRTPTVVSAASAGGGPVPGTPGVAAGLSRAASHRVPPLGVAGGSTAGASGAGVVPSTPGGPESSRGTGATVDVAAAAASTTGVLVVGHPGTPSKGPPSEYARSEYARSEIGDGSTTGGGSVDDQGPEHDLLPDFPPSWVPKLTIPRDMLDMRCPRGSRTTLYKRCMHEIFAGFGECARWDGLVERLTKYADDARHVVTEVREIFARRRDKLKERRSYPQQDAVQEFFLPGSLFAVKHLHTIRGERRVINFYSAARLDGLVRRQEVFGTKLVENFTGRDDRLEYRSATFGSAGPHLGLAGAGAASMQGTDGAGRDGDAVARASEATNKPQLGLVGEAAGAGVQDRALPVKKMTEKYARNPDMPADMDVAKQAFYVADGKILVQYHHGEGRLTAGYLLFHKDGQAQAVQVDPLAPKPCARELLETYKALQVAEKEALQHVRDSEWEGREIARTRTTQEQNITLEAPYYDICRIQADDSDDEPADSEASTYDYLLPFLPPGMTSVASTGSLTREQALAVRERCLRALKDRLIERANIIQARLDEEQAALARRQAAFARDRDALTPAEEEEYEKAADETTFRIGILQRRLARHEEAALQKYYELDKKLRNDARLAVLLTPI